jgi:hypothetical protein
MSTVIKRKTGKKKPASGRTSQSDDNDNWFFTVYKSPTVLTGQVFYEEPLPEPEGERVPT